jgi:hypothetical protein
MGKPGFNTHDVLLHHAGGVAGCCRKILSGKYPRNMCMKIPIQIF